jgi:glycosyltransferase involved in cell wall biosynthesis
MTMEGAAGRGASAFSKTRDGVGLEARGSGAATSALMRGGEAPRAERATEPLVSVIMFVRNGMPHVKRALASVLKQDLRNLEFVIQDGASNDGTVEYIRSLNDPRIKLISEKDDGPADAFARAVTRARGEILASCLADEELHHDALSRVVALFEKHPYLGAITGDADITDIHGNVYAKFEGGPFNILKYMTGEYCPYWCSSFFKMDALRFVGVFDERWSKASLEFEIWVRLAMDTDILYVPEIFSKYAHHSDQLSQSGGRAAEEMDARLTILRDRLFGPGKYFGENYGLRDVFCLLQLKNLHHHFTVWSPQEAEKVLQRIVDADYLREFNAHQGVSAPAPAPAAPPAEPPPAAPLEAHAPADVPAAPTPAPPPPSMSAPVVRDGFVPAHEFIVSPTSRLGSLYRRFVPRSVRHMIPRDFKIRLARRLGLRKG